MTHPPLSIRWGSLLLWTLLLAMMVFQPGLAQRHAPLYQARRFVEGHWVLVGGVEPAVESDLLRPLLLNARDKQLFVFDFGDYALKAFDWTGGLRWVIGHYGWGPNEFRSPSDLQFDDDNNIWVLDSGSRRVTIVGFSGQSSWSVQLRIGNFLPFQVMPSTDTTFWVTGNDLEATFALKLDKHGEVSERLLLPDRFKVPPNPLVRQAYVSQAGPKRAFVAFSRAGSLLRWDVGQKTVELFPGVEPVPFPDVIRRELRSGATALHIDTTAMWTALDVSTSGDTTYVLFAGESSFKGRIVDMYSTGIGSYLGSYLLPEKISDLVLDGGYFVGLVQGPVPAIRVWQWQPS